LGIVIVLSDERGGILSFSRQSLVGPLPMFVHRRWTQRPPDVP